MDSSRRSFDRSRESGVKRARMSADPNLRDPRLHLLNSGGGGGVVRGVRAQTADVRYRQIEKEDEANGGGYHPTHQLFSELVSEYKKGLAELTVNSKPIITNLTIIAGENLHAAKSIAEAICSHIIEVFCKAYKQAVADSSIQAGLRHLFRTWEGVFPLPPLQMIEKELGNDIALAVNGSASVSARIKPEPQSQYPQKSIHVNPKYLESKQKLHPSFRVKGPTNDISSDVFKFTGSAAKLGNQDREPVTVYEKDAEVAFGNYNFTSKKSSVLEQEKQLYKTGNNKPDTVLGQRNGYDGNRTLGSYVSPQSHFSRANDGVLTSWKNNEEEEYLWDDINSGVNKPSPTGLATNESECTIPGVVSKSLMAADKSFEEPEVKNLIGFEFKPSLIRQLQEPVVQDLINGLPYRLDKHMEWHSSKELDNVHVASRRWFPDLDDWVAGISSATAKPADSTEETEDAPPDDESRLVPADENQCVCIVCGELFEDYYSHDENAWMFRRAIRVKSSGTSNHGSQDLVVHSECFSESSALDWAVSATMNTGRCSNHEKLAKKERTT